MKIDDMNLRRDMVATCRRMNEMGIDQGAHCNLSAREDDHILITPTSLPYRQDPAGGHCPPRL